MSEKYYVYILECMNGSFYTGCAKDLKKRYNDHLNGRGSCKYTRSFPPLRIAASWSLEGGRRDAMRVESFIKRHRRNTKEALIERPQLLTKMVKEKLGTEVDVFTS